MPTIADRMAEHIKAAWWAAGYAKLILDKRRAWLKLQDEESAQLFEQMNPGLFSGTTKDILTTQPTRPSSEPSTQKPLNSLWMTQEQVDEARRQEEIKARQLEEQQRNAAFQNLLSTYEAPTWEKNLLDLYWEKAANAQALNEFIRQAYTDEITKLDENVSNSESALAAVQAADSAIANANAERGWMSRQAGQEARSRSFNNMQSLIADLKNQTGSQRQWLVNAMMSQLAWVNELMWQNFDNYVRQYYDDATRNPSVSQPSNTANYTPNTSWLTKTTTTTDESKTPSTPDRMAEHIKAAGWPAAYAKLIMDKRARGEAIADEAAAKLFEQQNSQYFIKAPSSSGNSGFSTTTPATTGGGWGWGGWGSRSSTPSASVWAGSNVWQNISTGNNLPNVIPLPQPNMSIDPKLEEERRKKALAWFITDPLNNLFLF